jgi:hypothetical protein
MMLAVSLGGCSGGGGEKSDGGAPDGGNEAHDACAAITGKRFVSLSALECGLAGDGGVVLCYWHVTFSPDGTFDWQHSDYAVSGTFACAGNNVTGTYTQGATVAGTWDPKTARLSWADQSYQREGS